MSAQALRTHIEITAGETAGEYMWLEVLGEAKRELVAESLSLGRCRWRRLRLRW